MLSSCLKLLLGLSLFVINTKCMPTDANEDDKIDETDGHDEKRDKGCMETNVPLYMTFVRPFLAIFCHMYVQISQN